MLSQSSPYFADLFVGKAGFAYNAMSDLQEGLSCPTTVTPSEYGYEDDSDLEDESDEEGEQVQITNEAQSDTKFASLQKNNEKMCSLTKWPSGESHTIDKNNLVNKSKETRHIFIKDTAFRT
ncbi:hypothetical protein ID866_9693 [Astraeus odoratus]|nr:hypothetical protein ID866_9693 [Astraeus odoratus]